MIKAKRIILVFVSLFIIIILASCGVSTINNYNNTPSTSGNNNSTPNTSDNISSGDTNQSTNEDKYYTITFKNDNGDILLSDSYKEGSTPIYNGIPTKENTAEYTFTFSGWNPSIITVTKDCEYVATYTATKNKYTVTWKNYDGEVLETDTNVEYGTRPSYDGDTPTKESNAEYTYTFDKWSPEIVDVIGDATYIATFKNDKNTYTYTFFDEDGITPLKEEIIEYGNTIVPPSNPTKESNAQYSYEFDGWYTSKDGGIKVESFGIISSDIEYYARYNNSINTYTVTWKNYNGEVLETDTNVRYGTQPSYDGETPTKSTDAEYTYLFDKWSPEITIVIGDTEYIATYTSTKNKYTVIWKNYDGEVLETDTNVEYGSMPSYDGDTPLKPQDDTYYYSFSGWTPTKENVTGNIEYIATFSKTSIPYYTITFKDYDETILQSLNVKEGTLPTYNKSNPTRLNDDNYSYEFLDWNEEIVVATENKVYVAIYKKTDLPYSIIIDLNGGLSNTTKLQFKTDNVSKDILPFDLTKKGYVFKGYELNGNKVFDEIGNTINSFDNQSEMTFKAIFDESIKLTIYYTLSGNTYTELFEELGDISKTSTYKFNTYVDLHAYPNEGYTFVGWYNNGYVLSNEKDYKYMMWDEDFTIEARFKYTSYKLNVWSNNYDLGQVMIREGYSQTFYNEETLNEYYTQSVTIAAYTKSDIRFLGWYNELNQLVSTNAVYQFTMPNKNYKLEAKWNNFNITYDIDGGINNENNPTYYDVDMENITLLEPTKDGYTFIGFEYNGNVITEINTSNICHMELKALWTANTNTAYKVEHYLQNLDDDNYPSTPYETDNLTGTTDTQTAGSVKTYEGFISPTITQVNINGDGSTVIKLNYTRNSYDLSLNINNEKAGSITDVSGIYKYGKEITIKAETNPGYTFNGWYDGDNQVSPLETYTFNMPASNLSYTAKWTANTNTTYKVEHYLQNLDDNNYQETPYETDNLTGTTDTLTNGEVKTYEGFTSPTITQVNINGAGTSVIKLYYERNSYDLSLSINNEKAGTITGAGTYKYGKEITITAETNPGYTFNGWYLNNSLYEEGSSFIYILGATNVSFEARYTANKYTITIDNQATGVTISGVTSGNEYDYDSQIVLTATNIPDGYTIKWSRSDGSFYVKKSITFNVPLGNITITTTIVLIPYTRNGNKIYFGTYPQTKVYATTENGLSSITFDGTWSSYKSFSQSSLTYYKDVDTNNDGIYDYRGVYLTMYRSEDIFLNDTTSSNTYQDDNGYTKNKIYWFRYDPIEWDILFESNGKVLILSNLILDSQEYNPSNSYDEYKHNGGTGYTNNYELSYVRKFLNDIFYNTAFNDLQKTLIETTTVNNSAPTTANNPNYYTCNKTKDNIFMLSYSEVTSSTYGLNSTSLRKANGSDYSKCQGLFVSTSSSTLGYSYWWLRSPVSNSACYACVVNCDGTITQYSVYNTSIGVRPACWINL